MGWVSRTSVGDVIVSWLRHIAAVHSLPVTARALRLPSVYLSPLKVGRSLPILTSILLLLLTSSHHVKFCLGCSIDDMAPAIIVAASSAQKTARWLGCAMFVVLLMVCSAGYLPRVTDQEKFLQQKMEARL